MFRIRENEIADALTTADIWQIMLKEVPPIAAEYFIGGAGSLNTMKSNVLAFQQVMLAPSGAVKHKKLRQRLKYLGTNFLSLFLQLRLEAFAHCGQWVMQSFLKLLENLEQPLRFQLFQ